MNHATRYVLIALLYFSSSALVLAQRMDYADSWVVLSNGSASLVGSAVTDEPYTSYGHEYYVTATLTSEEDGRTAVSWANGGSCGYSNIQCTRADVSLPILTNDELLTGNFFLESIHEGTCPYYAMNLSQAYFGIPLLVGASVTVLKKALSTNFYTKIPNCSVACPVDQYIAGSNLGQFIQGLVPWVYFYGYQCAPGVGIYPGSSLSTCRELVGVVNLPFP